MKLLIDEMFPATLARQLRARGHDVVSVHDPAHRALEGAPDNEVFVAAASAGRALVTENVPDFRRLEAATLAKGGPSPLLVFTTDRQFLRGDPRTIGRLVNALDSLLRALTGPRSSMFLRVAPD